MSFTEKIVVARFSGKVMHSGKVMLDCTKESLRSNGNGSGFSLPDEAYL